MKIKECNNISLLIAYKNLKRQCNDAKVRIKAAKKTIKYAEDTISTLSGRAIAIARELQERQERYRVELETAENDRKDMFCSWDRRHLGSIH